MEKLNFDKQSLRDFGKKSTIGLCILGILFFLLKKDAYIYFWIASGVFAVLTLAVPKSMKSIYVISMHISEPIGWVMSKIIFSIFFFIIITPVGLAMRLLGKDPLNRKIDKALGSYWLEKDLEPYDKDHFEKQF